MTDTTVELFTDTADFDRLAQPARRYPVLVKVWNTYVVEVEADSSREAAQQILDGDTIAAYEATQHEPAVDGGLEVDDIDWHNHYLIADQTVTDFGPWLPGEPRYYGWRSWPSAQRVRRCEEDIAAAMAEGLPRRCPTCAGHGAAERCAGDRVGETVLTRGCLLLCGGCCGEGQVAP